MKPVADPELACGGYKKIVFGRNQSFVIKNIYPFSNLQEEIYKNLTSSNFFFNSKKIFGKILLYNKVNSVFIASK